MNNKCRKCGANIPENAKFCPQCGATQQDSEPQHRITAHKKPDRKIKYGIGGNNLIFLVFLIALIIVVIYGYRFFLPPASHNTHTHTNNIPKDHPPVSDQKINNDLKSPLDANPDGFKENLDMGNFLFDNKRFEEALNHYNKALKIEPQNCDVMVDVGVCYFNMNNIDEAKRYFTNALKINSEHPNALYNLGVVASQTGDMKLMLESWEKLVEVEPESELAQTAKQMIDQVKKSMSDK